MQARLYSACMQGIWLTHCARGLRTVASYAFVCASVCLCVCVCVGTIIAPALGASQLTGFPASQPTSLRASEPIHVSANLLAQVETSPFPNSVPGLQPTAVQQKAVPKWAALLMALILLWLFACTALYIWLMRRCRAIEMDMDRRQRERKAKAAPKSLDPWTESARRTLIPTAEELLESSDTTSNRGETKLSASARERPNSVPPVALVTGGARRVGRATCLSLAKQGYDIIVTYRSSEKEADALLVELKALGVRARADKLDTSDAEAVDAYASALAEADTPLDALVLNASAYAPTPLESLDADTILNDFQVNALSGLLLSARLAPALRASKVLGGGSIVVMCDIHAMGRPRKGFASYNISKAAACELVATLARELAPHVRVNGVAPGVVAWPEAGHESEKADQAKYLRRVPLGRTGTPQDAAEAVRWLIADATYVTGQIVRIDGGRWIT